MAGKTIAEIAAELGVSKTAVRKKIDNLGLRTNLQTSGNLFLILETDEKLIKSAFFRGNAHQAETESTNDSRNVHEPAQTPVLDVLAETIAVLRTQLAVKDEQIKDLNARLAEAHKMADYAQQLHGADKVLELQGAQGPQPVTEVMDKPPRRMERFKQFIKGK